MDEKALKLEKERIDEELRRIRHATKKAQKDDEDRALIVAGEGRVSYAQDVAIPLQLLTVVRVHSLLQHTL